MGAAAYPLTRHGTADRKTDANEDSGRFVTLELARQELWLRELVVCSCLLNLTSFPACHGCSTEAHAAVTSGDGTACPSALAQLSHSCLQRAQEAQGGKKAWEGGVVDVWINGDMANQVRRPSRPMTETGRKLTVVLVVVPDLRRGVWHHRGRPHGLPSAHPQHHALRRRRGHGRGQLQHHAPASLVLSRLTAYWTSRRARADPGPISTFTPPPHGTLCVLRSLGCCCRCRRTGVWSGRRWTR